MADILKYLLVGLVFMIILSFVRNDIYQLKKWKIILLMILLMISGVLGTCILFFIESGYWGGTSFYGALFLIPIFFAVISKIFSIPYGRLMDYCAVPICAMLAVMKFRCLDAGCCSGKEIFNGAAIFPSQMVEASVILLIILVLHRLEKQEKYRHKIYPVLLLLYGSTRFVLNSFREGLTSFVGILPAGHYWSIVAVAIGVCSLLYIKMSKKE